MISAVSPMPHLPLAVPPALARTVRELYGPAGDAWLAALPALVADLAHRWRLTVGPPFALSYNYVCAARQHDGGEVVLKVGFPNPELTREIAALRYYAGDGACRILAADAARGALLLERLRPGETLAAVASADDVAATRIGAAVMRRLWRPVPAPPDGDAFLPLTRWFRAFGRHRAAFGGPGPFPADLLAHAEPLAAELAATAPATVVLHGDFHHENVLSAERTPWLAIDPKGMLGDPGYEAGPFLLNPHPDRPDKDARTLSRRLDVLADELGYERRRLRDWGVVHAVMSACWSAEGHGRGWEGAIATAELLRGL